MNKLWLIFTITLFSILGSLCISCQGKNDEKRNAVAPLWKKVEKSLQSGLPETALKDLEIVIAKTKELGLDDENARALALRALLKGETAEDGLIDSIELLKKDIPSMNAEIRPLINILMARWIYSYYNANSWQILGRTAADLKTSDMKVWDAPRFFSEIDFYFNEAFKSEDFLKKNLIKEYSGLIDPGNTAEIYPKLFDFAVYSAIDFYSSKDSRLVKSEDAFEIDPSSAAFGDSDDFLAYKPVVTDTNSGKYKALLLFQKLLSFHKNDSDKNAFVHADIMRLEFVKNASTAMEEKAKDDLYIKRLNELSDKHANTGEVSWALHHIARIYIKRNEYDKALEIINKAKKNYPKTYGTDLARNLELEIYSRELNLSVESLIPTNKKALIKTTSRNLSAVTIGIYKIGMDKFAQSYFNDQEINGYLKSSPIKSFRAELNDKGDHTQSESEITLPLLSPGYYLLLAGGEKNFSASKNIISYTKVNVSNISGVIRNAHSENSRIFTVNYNGGEPAPDVEVSLYNRVYTDNSYKSKFVTKIVSDASGKASFSAETTYDSFFVLKDKKGNETLVPGLYYYKQSPQELIREQTIIFTDRSLYRPGQKIHYKAVAIRYNPFDKKYSVISDQKIKITFNDTSGKEIASQEHTANKFGSAWGTFTSPSDRLAGRMSIRSDYPVGTSYINVEEYKRPKFFVKLQAPEKAYRLKEKITLTGSADTYSGTAVDNAKVSYKVKRNVRYPIWLSWLRPGPTSTAQEIAHGTVTADAKGKFSITFTALPDLAVNTSESPVFEYSVTADVTDSAGETRSDTTDLRVGYSSLELLPSAAEWQIEDKDVKAELIVNSLQGKPQAVSGTLSLYSLVSPSAPEQATSGNNDRYAVNSQMNWQSQLSKWKKGNLVKQESFKTSSDGKASFVFKLKAGAYMAEFSARDSFDSPALASLPILVIKEDATAPKVMLTSFFIPEKKSLLPGETFKAIWGTGFSSGSANIAFYKNGKILKSYWTKPDKTQHLITLPVTKDLRGGFTAVIFAVKNGRLYSYTEQISVPWANKEMKLTFESLRLKYRPGEESKFIVHIAGKEGKLPPAEVLCSMYDKSLDAFKPHVWEGLSSFLESESTSFSLQSPYEIRFFTLVLNSYTSERIPVKQRIYPNFCFPLVDEQKVYYDGYAEEEKSINSYDASGMSTRNRALAPSSSIQAASPQKSQTASGDLSMKEGKSFPLPEESQVKDQPASVQVRKDFAETVFFKPDLRVDSNGNVSVEFKMPDSLTTWRIMSLAHGELLESGYADATTITQKDLMTETLAPRFLREGDVIDFAVKVSNTGKDALDTSVTFSLTNPETGALLKVEPDSSQKILIPAGQSKSVFWKYRVPGGINSVLYRSSASGGVWSDGEENILPVIASKVFVTESKELWINGKGEKKFTFDQFKNSTSPTLKSHMYVVQMASNPIWYAIGALPYLMEFPHECNEQIFSRIYANTIAANIASSDPEIKKVFERWKKEKSPASRSNLENNTDLKNILLLETPWAVEAENETKSKERIAELFDKEKVNSELKKAFTKLEQNQLSSGGWPWFPGGQDDFYITLQIVAGFGKLSDMKLSDYTVRPSVKKAVEYTDREILKIYKEIKPQYRAKYVPDPSVVFYLYARSFYLAKYPIPSEVKAAANYFLDQGSKFFLSLGSPMTECHFILAESKFGRAQDAKAKALSVKERMIKKEELGMFFKQENTWMTYRAPIETQALVIELFTKVLPDKVSLSESQKWLIKQKQTQNWKSTKATADAIYALMISNKNALKREVVSVKLGGSDITPDTPEAGTGFYEKRFTAADIKQDMGNITVSKKDDGIAYGGVYWQYFEDINKITPHSESQLNIKKEIYLQENTKSGPVLRALSDKTLKPGDLLKIRLEIRSDRNMDYIHISDDRPSGCEPTEVLSGYKYGEFAYYQTTKDASTHFFANYLPRGTYVLEYSLRVLNKGRYSSGIARIECMYAPEFSGHTGSVVLTAE